MVAARPPAEEEPAGHGMGAPPGQKKPAAHGVVPTVMPLMGQKKPAPHGVHVLALPMGLHEPVESRDMVCCSAEP